MAKTIDYYFSPFSPFTYLAGDQLEKEASGAINYHPIDLPPLFSQTGAIPLPQRSEQRKAYRYVELERIAKKRNLPINLNPAHFPTDGRPACKLLLAVRENAGPVAQLLHALLKAVWVEERDISDATVLSDIATQLGINQSIIDSAEQYDQLLDQETEAAVKAGVFGVPFYVVDDEPFWGQDKLTDALQAAQ